MLELSRCLELFSYEPETGILVRKFKSGARKIVKPSSDKTRIKVRIDGHDYQVHRVIWLMVYGYLPEKFIDHVNGNPLDNRLENLRLATDAQNKRNVGPRSHNKSGIKGVSWDKTNSKWLAHATHNSVGITIGRFAEKEDAANAYREWARVAHGEFYREEK